MILIIGAPDEAHSAHMAKALQERGETIGYFDPRVFPRQMQLHLSLAEGLPSVFLSPTDTEPVSLTDIKAVYWRYFLGMPPYTGDPDAEPYVQEMAQRELQASIGNFFRMLDERTVRWVNSPAAIEMHRFKLYQLLLMRQAGIPVPDTLITNDAERLRAFYERCGRTVIYKPVAGGAHAAMLTPDDFAPERADELAKVPVQFQNYVPGVDIRVYVIGDALFAAEIQAETVDFRNHPEAPIVPIELPAAVQEQCHTVSKLLHYRYTGIDIRRTPDGQHIFLEGNPAPMFMHFERVTGYPITDALADLLSVGTVAVAHTTRRQPGGA